MKNALARKLDSEGADMEPAEERQLFADVSGLRSDVRHVQSDVTEIKARLDKFETKVEERFKGVETKTDEKFKDVDKRFDEIKDMINGVKVLIASAKVWAYGLYVALAGSLLYIIGHVAKWF